MKKITLLLFALFLASLTINAATGWYQDYVKLNVNGTGTSGPTGWYWIGSDPAYATQLQGAALGTVSSLVLTGADMKYWANDGNNRTGGAFYYKIMNSDNTVQIIPTTETIWSHASIGGNDYQGTITTNINLITGLAPGTSYQLHVWAKSWGDTGGDSWLTNSSANYVATFTTSYYWGATTAVAWDATTGTRWGINGVYDTNWVSGSAAVFNVASSLITGATTNFSSITANENVTLTAGGTLGTGGTVAPITVASAKLFNFGSQPLSTAAGTGFTKNGVGTLAIATGGNYTGGFTLNAGMVVVGGVNALGAGGALTINGGTLAANAARDLSGKYTGGITIGGDFTLGSGTTPAVASSNLTFTNNMDLGGVTRTITIGGTGTYAFNGIISNGGLTINNTAAGIISLGGINTFTGTTSLNAGVLVLNPSADISNLTPYVLNGGKLSTSGIVTARTITASTIQLTSNTTIELGTNAHTLSFAASNAISWTTGKKLIITNWKGTAGTSGTVGKIFVGNSNAGLSASQLAQIYFAGYKGTAMILSTGEVVPSTATAPAMTGIYKVGVSEVSPNFISLSEAAMVLGSSDITGDIVFEITSDITEPENIGLAFTSSFTLTIRPDADVDRTITFDHAADDNLGPSGAFNIGIGTSIAWADLTPTKNIIIDGYSVGGSTRRLKIATATTHNRGNSPIVILDDCSNIQIKNCIIEHKGAATGTATGIYAIYLRVNTSYGTKKMPSNITIENNDITCNLNGNSQGIAIYANGVPTSPATGIVIKKNKITVQHRGLFLYYLNGLEITDNEFRVNQTGLTGMLSGAIIGGNNGIDGSINILNNKFIELKSSNSSAGTFGIRGIIASGVATSIWNIYNNYFTGFNKNTATGTTTMLQAIRCGSNPCNIRNNTFLMNSLTNKPTGNLENPTDAEASYCAINIAGGTPEIKNNIFISDEDGAYNHAIRGFVTGITNYNNYFLRAGNTKARINSNYATFATYRAANSTKDIDSKNVDVSFVSTTDLSLSGTSIDDINLAVPRLASVSKDINGFDRWLNTHAGAHEPNMLKAYMKSNATGSWGANGSWEMSDDNATWEAATQVPSSSATAISILKDHEITIDAAATASAVTINAGGKLTLNDGVTFTFTDHYGMNFASNITIESNSTDGAGTYVDKNSTIVDNISTTVNQELSARSWYLSPPVNSFHATSMLGDVETYDETSNTWGQGGPDNEMTAGKGYLVNPGAETNIPFRGTLNNGLVEVELTRSDVDNLVKPGFNLIGNPYPSYIDWTTLYAANTGTANMPTSTMWYRSKSFGPWDFYTVNGAGDVSVPSTVSKFIPPMQAFWVRTNSGGGTMNFTNAMRLHSSVPNLLKAPALNNRQLVRLQLTNGTNTDEMVIYANENATNGLDIYDSQKMHNTAAIPEFYTSINNEHLVINGMNEIPLNTEIPITFKAGNSTSLSITANEISNLDTNTKLILKDKVTKFEADLTDGITKYDFTPDATDASRFSLIFKVSGVISSTQTINKDENILIHINGNKLVTVRTKETPNASYSVMLFNSTGQLLNIQKMSSTVTVINQTLSSGLYIVKIIANGKTTTKKLIIN